MNDSNTYQAVRIGDIADWRLICEISATGISAYLKHTNPAQDIVTLIDEKWERGEDLLQKIENAVYDHPQVLDDFSADIAIVAPKSIWVPKHLLDEEDEENIAFLYNQVYSAEEGDIMSDTVDSATCLYSLVPGLNAFLQRTFPGSRLHSHLAVMTSRFRERTADMPRVYAEIRDGEVDILAFDHKNLLMAATHTWRDPMDIQYHIFNVINVYELDPQNLQLSLSGNRDVKNLLLPELRKTISYVMMTMLPSLSNTQLPTTAALLLRQ